MLSVSHACPSRSYIFKVLSDNYLANRFQQKTMNRCHLASVHCLMIRFRIDDAPDAHPRNFFSTESQTTARVTYFDSTQQQFSVKTAHPLVDATTRAS